MLIFTILGTSYISIRAGSPNQYLYEYLLPTTMIEAFMIFIFMKEVGKKKFFERKCAYISQISKCTFGIYLVHDYIKAVIFKIGITVDFINPILTVPIFSVIIFTVSFIIIYFCRKLPISKYIM